MELSTYGLSSIAANFMNLKFPPENAVLIYLFKLYFL